MSGVTVNQFDLANLRATLAGIGDGAGPILNWSINKGIDGVRPETKDILSRGFNYKARAIDKQIKKPPKLSGSRVRTKVVIGEGAYGRGKGTPVIDFRNGRMRKNSGYTAVFKRKKVELKHAFKATMKSGHVGVFVRVGKTNLFTGNLTRKAPSERKEAIKEIFSTSVVDAIRNPRKLPILEKRVMDRMTKELDRQITLLLKGL